MKVNLAKFYNAIEVIRREVASYDTKNMVNYIMNIELVEADLNKGIPITVLTVSCDYEKDGKKQYCAVEIYDDMDSQTPVVTTRRPIRMD
jgi:hypothetical protein